MSSPPQEDSPTWVSAAFLVGKPHIAFVPAIEKQHLCGAVPKCVLFVPEKSGMLFEGERRAKNNHQNHATLIRKLPSLFFWPFHFIFEG